MLVPFSQPLVQATLLKRYKRFFADALLENGQEVTAHCANTGSMKTCAQPGDTVFLLHNPSPTRKLAYTWELTAVEGGFVGVNTARPNQLAKAAVTHGRISELLGYADVRSEVKYDEDSRIDLLLSGCIDAKKAGQRSEHQCFVEVKNTTLLSGDSVMFPDAVTSRGLKHLRALESMVRQGHRAVMLYMVNRPEGKVFKVATSIDPAYAEGLCHAVKAGVEVLAYRVTHSVLGLDLGGPVEVMLPAR